MQNIWTNFIADKSCEAQMKPFDAGFLRLLSVLDVKNYCSHSALTVIFVALAPDFFSEKERIIYRKKTNEIEIRINLNYENFINAKENEVFHFLAETYLLAVDRFLSKRKDFQTEKI